MPTIGFVIRESTFVRRAKLVNGKKSDWATSANFPAKPKPLITIERVSVLTGETGSLAFSSVVWTYDSSTECFC